MREPIPLRQRPADVVVLTFFITNITLITYMLDLEQTIIKDPANFEYPIWPPKFIIDAVHWWGNNFDPALMARPVWWQMTIWIDTIFFGPFYAFAIYAFWKGREWIRIPCIIWASVMMTNVTIIMGEEFFGPHATTNPAMVVLANASWFLFPAFVIYRMWKDDHPFTREILGQEN